MDRSVAVHPRLRKQNQRLLDQQFCRRRETPAISKAVGRDLYSGLTEGLRVARVRLSLAQPFTAGFAKDLKSEAPLNGAFFVRLLMDPGVNAWAREKSPCLGEVGNQWSVRVKFSIAL